MSRNQNWKKPLLWLVILLISHEAKALDEWMRYIAPEGVMQNSNSPVQDQKGGYLSGGSLILRGPRPKELAPINIQTPKLQYDACTGSGDFRFGAMSYISGEEFSRFLKNVARASGAYLVKMSIKTACPQCEDIMTYLETVARDINNFTINQCSMAQMVAAGAFSKIVTNEKQLCMVDANISRDNRDMFETTKRCQENAGLKRSKNSPEKGGMLGDEFNLVWRALSQGRSSHGNLKELMMSISGTIIMKKEDGRYRFEYKPSLVVNEHFLEKYIGGGNGSTKVRLYECDTKSLCLNPRLKDVTLESNKNIYGNIARILRSIIQKVKDNNPKLSDEEEALISFSTIPILNLIEMEIATKAKEAHMLVRISEFVEAICYDVMINYIQILVNKTIMQVKNLRYAQLDDSLIKAFMADCEHVRKYLKDSRFLAFKKLQILLQVKERLDLQTKEFEHRFARFMKDME